MDDPLDSVFEADFHYEVEFEDGVDALDTDHELGPDETIEYADVLCTVVTIGPPDADGVRRVILRRVHPDPHE